MTGGFSLYLDLIRTAAALEVFFYHLGQQVGTIGVSNAYGHEAVVVFFVLSGYVISFAATRRDKTLRRFTISRLTRLYSVAVPAVILTVALDYSGLYINPSLYDGFAPLHSPLVRFFTSIFLLNETWVSVQAFSNGPFWSLSYELAYYAIFAAFFFLSGPARRVTAALCVLFVGIRPILLFPIWVLGSWAFSETQSHRWHRVVHWTLFLALVPGLWAYSLVPAGGIAVEGVARNLGYSGPPYDFGHSRFFLSDYYLGVVFTLHLLGAKNLGPSIGRALAPIAPLLRQLSAYSYALYMVHFPVILFMRAAAGTRTPSAWWMVAIISAVFTLTFLLGIATENWRRQFKHSRAATH